MRQFLGTALAAAVAALMVGGAVPAAARVETPRVRAWPGSDLQDGQEVTVFGKGFLPSRFVGLAQCPAGPTTVVDACVGHSVVDSNGGSFAGIFRVQRFVHSTDCSASPAACVIAASNLDGPGAFTAMAVARLRFGPPGHILQSTLTGFREIGGDGGPGAGDLDAVGAATLTVRASSVCATLSVKGVDLPSVAAHVHEAEAGANGPIVIPLKPPGRLGRSHACITGVDPGLLSRLTSRPDRFYVNVHTGAFPNGAVRGQLAQAEREGPMYATRLSGSRVIDPAGHTKSGDPDGFGVVTATFDAERILLCLELHVRGIALPAIAAHLHSGRPVENGSVEAALAAPGPGGRSSSCVRPDYLLLDRGAQYVDVHTGQFPDGALRAQLFPAAALAG